MSKNITIQEGGIAKQLTVDKLKTSLVGGGSCIWVSEDAAQLTTKSITRDGTYKASDDGYYGYSEVTVSSIGTVTGKDPDGSGDEATAYVDPETGEIVVEKIPSSIEVITPPTNPYGTYVDGQTITKDGMVVKGYTESGDEWGTVPNGEITLNPTTAVYDQSKDRPGGKEVVDTPLDIGSASIFVGSGVPYIYYTPTSGPSGSTSPYIFGYPDGVVFTLDAWHVSDSSIGYYMIVASGSLSQYTSNSYTYNGETVYYDVADTAFNQQNISVDGTNASLSGYDKAKAKEIAWSMVYGTIQEKPAGSPQTITVSWPRPGDGSVLTNTFEINVGPRSGGQGED